MMLGIIERNFKGATENCDNCTILLDIWGQRWLEGLVLSKFDTQQYYVQVATLPRNRLNVTYLNL